MSTSDRNLRPKTAGSSPQDRLADVRARYAERLRSQRSELLECLAALDSGADVREQLRSFAHRLHGSAGSFGFDRVSQVAAHVESALLNGASARDVAPTALQLARLMETAE